MKDYNLILTNHLKCYNPKEETHSKRSQEIWDAIAKQKTILKQQCTRQLFTNPLNKPVLLRGFVWIWGTWKFTLITWMEDIKLSCSDFTMIYPFKSLICLKQWELLILIQQRCKWKYELDFDSCSVTRSIESMRKISLLSSLDLKLGLMGNQITATNNINSIFRSYISNKNHTITWDYT